ncbi:hypothetical protein BKA56DRAFT_623482 [Ilyonectria sp. MPI-CAGE-AT-0026]|nr:hypothetical protein BKA56DRAFT_623482 [Ilyonectria sp. MPI-CAGE-AT-0026]
MVYKRKATWYFSFASTGVVSSTRLRTGHGPNIIVTFLEYKANQGKLICLLWTPTLEIVPKGRIKSKVSSRASARPRTSTTTSASRPDDASLSFWTGSFDRLMGTFETTLYAHPCLLDASIGSRGLAGTSLASLTNPIQNKSELEVYGGGSNGSSESKAEARLPYAEAASLILSARFDEENRARMSYFRQAEMSLWNCGYPRGAREHGHEHGCQRNELTAAPSNR